MNCKPGDLAIVIGGGILENIGKIVLVESLSLPGRKLRDGVSYSGSVPAWQVIGSLWTRDESGGRLMSVRSIHYHDSFLKPLPSEPVTEEIRDEVTA